MLEDARRLLPGHLVDGRLGQDPGPAERPGVPWQHRPPEPQQVLGRAEQSAAGQGRGRQEPDHELTRDEVVDPHPVDLLGARRGVGRGSKDVSTMPSGASTRRRSATGKGIPVSVVIAAASRYKELDAYE